MPARYPRGKRPPGIARLFLVRKRRGLVEGRPRAGVELLKALEPMKAVQHERPDDALHLGVPGLGQWQQKPVCLGQPPALMRGQPRSPAVFGGGIQLLPLYGRTSDYFDQRSVPVLAGFAR